MTSTKKPHNNQSEESAHGDMIHEAFKFWFNDHAHIRSPFPGYIQPELRQKATDAFLDWVNELPKKEDGEITDEIVVEKFEEILFSLALDMVKTEDERITLRFPFLPRIGDRVQEKGEEGTTGESLVVDRHFVQEGNASYLKVINETDEGKRWATRFELPV